jgi:hypothetical protein
MDLPEAFQYIIIVWQEEEYIECKHCVKLILILQSRGITLQQFHGDPLAFSSGFGYLNLFRSVVLSSALVATVRQPDYMSAVSTRNVEHISNSMSCMSAEGKFKKVELTFCGFSGPSLSLSQ